MSFLAEEKNDRIDRKAENYRQAERRLVEMPCALDKYREEEGCNRAKGKQRAENGEYGQGTYGVSAAKTHADKLGSKEQKSYADKSCGNIRGSVVAFRNKRSLLLAKEKIGCKAYHSEAHENIRYSDGNLIVKVHSDGVKRGK